MSSEAVIRSLLQKAGIEINGTHPWDIHIHNKKLYSRVLGGGTLALGEAYMDGWWDVKNLAEFFTRVLRARLDEDLPKSLSLLLYAASTRLFNLQSKARAFIVAEKHYDIGNDLYSKMLDKRLTYTCAYWSGTPNAKTLDEAEEAKLDLVCRKIGLKKGDRILDIGCGWGSFLGYAAEKYGATGVGVSVSKEQTAYACERYAEYPIEFRLQDYREVNEKFDHIISIGMFEAVGVKNFREYFEVAHRCLKDTGYFLLHTIGQNYSSTRTDPWIDKYIFPNGMLPSVAQIGASIERLFVMEDWHNFGPDYDKTLIAWHANFEKAWPELKEKYGERFYRMWKYYLLSCAGTFRARDTQLWQLVLSKKGMMGGYQAVR